MKLPAFRHVMYTRERLGGAPTRKQGMQNILKWPSRVPKLKGSIKLANLNEPVIVMSKEISIPEYVATNKGLFS